MDLLAAALYDRSAPLSVALIAPWLRDIGNAQGFKSNAASKQGVLISDEVKKLFPEHWLSAVFHEVVAKDPGVYLHQIDGALYLRTAASSTIAYLLVLSVLFESADHAINTMVEACSGKEAPALRSRPVQRRVPSADELLARYTEAKGVHAEVARQLDLPVHTVRKALCELGLPSLPEFDAESKFGVVAALRAYYLDKRSYSASFDVSGMTVGCFDALLRQCGPKLAVALGLMNLKGRSRPRARQAKGLLPPLQRDTARTPTTNQLREMLLQN